MKCQEGLLSKRFDSLIKTIIFCIFLASWLQLGIANEADNNEQFNATDSGADGTELNRQQVRQQKNTVVQLLSDIEKRYGETAAALHTLHVKIEQNRQHLDKIRQDIQTYQRQVDKESKDLADQVKAAYKMGRQEQLKLMFNQQDPALSSRMMVYYRYLNAARLEKIKQLEETVAKLEQLDKQKQAETESLEQNLQQKKTEQTALNNVRRQRNELLAHIANAAPLEEQLGYLKDSENTLKELIASLPNTNTAPEVNTKQTKDVLEPVNDDTILVTDDLPQTTGDFATLKGKLPWPVKGRLAQKFGSPRSETVWDGVLIDAQEGVEIHAVANGKVAFAQWLKSYGYLMIIEHGGGYMTLYAFNQSLYKQKNDAVKAGEVIAAVGQSGGRIRSGLYFGIRKQGIPIDPLDWCQR